jgi:hypothetical protein
MNNHSSTLSALSALSALLFATAVPAQDPDVRELSTPTGYG